MRRHLLIEPRFQAGFTFAFVRGVLLAIAVPAAVSFLTIQMLSKNPTLTDAERLTVLSLSHQVLILFVIVSGVLGALSAVAGLILSHRYAGPLKRVESWAARHLLGEPVDELVLRPGDELAGVAEGLSRILKQEKPKA